MNTAATLTTGSEKQIAFAEKARTEELAWLTSLAAEVRAESENPERRVAAIEALADWLRSLTDARVILDARGKGFDGLIMHARVRRLIDTARADELHELRFQAAVK